MPATTAQLRAMAHEAERLCDWRAAAENWREAAERHANPAGRLAQMDIARMKARAAACEASARIEAAPPFVDISYEANPDGTRFKLSNSVRCF